VCAQAHTCKKEPCQCMHGSACSVSICVWVSGRRNISP
jgi:hypothetical protein